MHGRELRRRRVGVVMVGLTLLAGVAVGVRPVSAAPGPQVSIGDGAMLEGDSGVRHLVLRVSLSEPSLDPITVTYDVAPGTATAGEALQPGADFRLPERTTLTFKPGQVMRMIRITTFPDTDVEGDETFNVTLTGADNGYALGRTGGTATILDDDPGTGTRVGVGDVSVDEGDSKARTVAFDISLSEPSWTAVSVDYAVVPETATGGSPPAGEVRVRTGTIVFKPTRLGVTATVKHLSVATYPDTSVESDETFQVVLTNVNGATLDRATGTGTIFNDD